jgi:double-stranded uracil-DNA glycosylase
MMSLASDSQVRSFPPQVAEGCRVLVLGTAPSVRSLALQQSYAHPQNLFWPLMGEMFDAGPDLAYAERIRRLQSHGVGIWDVYASCERPGSLDSAIVRASEVANDIPALLGKQPSIAAIAPNGGHAQRAFRRLVLPQIDPDRVASLTLLDLPSTSPANASMSRQHKRELWLGLLDFTS